MTARVDLRPRSNTELLDAAVEFIRSHFGVLATVTALWQIPALVVNVLWPPDRANPFAVWRTEPLLAGARTIFLMLVIGAFGLMFAGVVDDLLHGREVRLGDRLRWSISRAIPAAAGYVLKYLVIFLWLLLFLVPAIWAYARYFALFPAMAVEGLGPLAAIRRSKELARGNNIRVITVAGIPVAVGMFVIIIVQQTVAATMADPRMLGVAGALASVLLYPFMTVPAILVYYDIRTRREGLDLDVAALSAAPSPSAAA